jgi:hypothetical protein
MDPTTHTDDAITEPLLQNGAEDAPAADEGKGRANEACNCSTRPAVCFQYYFRHLIAAVWACRIPAPQSMLPACTSIHPACTDGIMADSTSSPVVWLPSPFCLSSHCSAELGTSTSPKPRGPVGTTHWLLTTCILLGDMFGLGSLTLPADFVRLGWIPALVLLILFGIGDIYSGLLYTRLLVALPDVVVFDQIGERAMGKLGKGLVYGSIYLTILAEPIIFHLTCVESLKQVRGCSSSCRCEQHSCRGP